MKLYHRALRQLDGIFLAIWDLILVLGSGATGSHTKKSLRFFLLVMVDQYFSHSSYFRQPFKLSGSTQKDLKWA